MYLTVTSNTHSALHLLICTTWSSQISFFPFYYSDNRVLSTEFVNLPPKKLYPEYYELIEVSLVDKTVLPGVATMSKLYHTKLFLGNHEREYNSQL
jgi:hypothetical protein